MFITPRQIRAARGLLNWHQKDLAARAGISKDSVKNIENEITHPQPSTLERIKSALELSGIVFTEYGVEYRKETVSFFEGDEWFSSLLDDVYNTMNGMDGAELIVDMGNDAISAQRPRIMERYRKIRAAGITMRQTIKQGDTFLLGPKTEYRWVPEAYYKNWIEVIYGPKVAISVAGEKKCMVIKDENLALREKLKFDLLWKLLKQPDRESTANVYF